MAESFWGEIPTYWPALLCPARPQLSQQSLHARLFANGNVESHPWRPLEMRAENRTRREHQSLVLRGFRQRQRILDMWEACPHEHAVRWLNEQFESDTFERAHDVQPSRAETLVQARQVLAIMPIHQHQINQPLGEQRRGNAGQHFYVGELVGGVLWTRDEANPQAA
jgi:hypothetical protein